ncbi:hypothetical protein [Rhodoblastus sp.]|uniref:hypothetical protein n=1 Tax=Rhodoblastus sp. TaxID=1962975 RepID=UPI003F9C5893
MADIILGIDPGVFGAIATLNKDRDLLSVEDMPVLSEGSKNRKTVNAPLLASIIYKSLAKVAFCELVGSRPGEGVVGAFGFGRSRGVIEGVLAAAGIPAFMLAPPAWKRLVGIQPGLACSKDAARIEAIRRWPGKAELFARVKDDGRAEAALIAIAGLMREGTQ